MDRLGLKKILLVRPFYGINVHADMHGDIGISDHQPQIFPDLTFIQAATIAAQAPDVDLEIIEGNLERLLPREIIERIRRRFDVIILKTAGPTIQCDLEFAREIKKRFPDTELVLAGQAAALVRTWIEHNMPEIDAVAAVPMDDFVCRLLHDANDVSINDYPTPDFSLFNYESFRDLDGVLRGSLFTSRGCAVGCSYCPYPRFFGNRVLFRDLDRVMEDMETLLSLGIEKIFFRDQYFTINPKRTEKLCRMILARGWKFKWRCETRLESLSPKLINLMVEAGMDMVCFGVESDDKRSLSSFHRPAVNEKKLKQLIQHLHKRNVFTLAFYIIGFPDDTWDGIRGTFELALRVGSNAAKFSVYSPCTPEVFPFTEMKPEHFDPFDNTMNVNPCRHLSKKEVTSLVNYLNNLYHTETIKRYSSPDYNYIKAVHDYHLVHQNTFRELVRDLRERVLGGDIFTISSPPEPAEETADHEMARTSEIIL